MKIHLHNHQFHNINFVSVEGRVNGMLSIMKLGFFWSAYTASCLVKADGMLVINSCVQQQVLEQENI